MAVKLIHKHSNNAYTNASSTDLEFGEIAVNNHESGPYLQVKGTDGNVYEVGGIYYNTHSPTNPLKGKFWLDQTTDQLRVWNGTAWIICAGVSGPAGPGFTGGSYDPSTGRITFTSDDGLGFTTEDLRGADGVDGAGFTGGSYDSSTGQVTFTSSDGLGFTTGDLRGADGNDGNDGDGFTGGSYDSTTGRATFTSDDGLGFETGDLRGAAGDRGPQGLAGADGDGFTGGYYSPSTGRVFFTSDDGLSFSTTDLRGTDGVDGTGFTGASYDPATGQVTFTSNDGLGFTTGDLRGADGDDGADGTGFTGGSYNASTGQITFTSDDGLGFTTGDVRGTDGNDGIDGIDGTGFTGGSYNASTGQITFTSNDGLGFTTADLRGADGDDGSTDLSYTASTRTINSSTGTNATLPNVAAGGNSGLMTGADKTKLNGIESGATGDQTASEIRALVQAASDSHVFTDADHTKLNGIEAGATADMTGAEIAAALANQDIETTGTIEARSGTGSVSLTANDGKGHANVTFNHRAGSPEQAGNSFRIETNVDESTGMNNALNNPTMYFEGGIATTAGGTLNLAELMRLEYDSGAFFPGYITTTGGNLSFKDIDGFGVEWTNSGLVSAHIYNDDSSSKFLIDLDNNQNFQIRYYDALSASYTSRLDLSSSGTLTLSGNQKLIAKEIERTGTITIDANGSGADVRLEGADHVILEAGKEEDGSIYFRGNSLADSYRFAKSGQTAIEGFLSFESLTQDHIFTFPDAAGTIALTTSTVSNADTVDNVHASSFIRKDNDTNVSAHTEWQDNYEIRLGNSADFRVKFNGNDTVFRNYKHTGGGIFFQGENSAGTNQNLIVLDTSGTRGYVRLFENANERLKTTSGGVTVTGTVTATTFSGNATSATNCSRTISASNGLTGGGQLNANRTISGVNASTSAKGVVQLSSSTSSTSTSLAATASAAKAAYDRAASYAPSKTGSGASGTWGISISGTATNSTNARIDHDTGNAWHRPVFIDDGKSSATNQRLKTDNASTIGINPNTNQIRATTFVGGLSGTATNCSRSIGAGNGLTGGGTLNANRTINVGAGTGITVNSNDVAVDSTVCRTDVNKTITGTYTFLNTPTCSNNLTVNNRIYVGSSDNGQAIEVDRSSSYNTHLYIGGWSSSNSNDIARIRCSNNLHLDSPANGAMYLNWYSKKQINFKGKIVGGDSTAVFRANAGSTGNAGYGFGSDNDTGFYHTNSNRISITTGGAFRGYMSGNDFRFAGIYNSTTGGGTNVRVDSNGRLRRHSSSRKTKTNIEPMEVEYAYKILDEVEPIWYRPRVPDPEWPQAYLDSLSEDEAPCISDCDAYCQDNEIDWQIGDKSINEGNNPDWSYWGFIAEDLAEIDPRLCQQNPETGEYDSVQYEEFTPLLLKIAQEQKKQITSLEERLSALEQKFSQCSACNPSV